MTMPQLFALVGGWWVVGSRRRVVAMLSHHLHLHRGFSFNIWSNGSGRLHRRMMSDRKCITVALVGRPNVGKSTLFNKLTKTNAAIVSAIPGTTRDRREGKGQMSGLTLNVLDTGGLDDRGAVSEQIQKQVKQAVEASDVVIFMLDAKAGITALDGHFVKWIRRVFGEKSKVAKRDTTSPSIPNNTELILVANKTEGAHLSDRVLDTVAEALELGMGEPILLSAAHGEGMAELASHLIAIAKARGLDNGDGMEEKKSFTEKISLEDRVIQLAVMGKPVMG